MSADKFAPGLVALLMVGLVLSSAFIVHVVVQHEPALVRIVEPRPEFGTLPPNCEGLDHKAWCECMGVPYR